MRVRYSTYATVNGRNVRSPFTPVTTLALITGLLLMFGAIFIIVGAAVRSGENKLKERCTYSVSAEVVRMATNRDDLVSPVYKYVYEDNTYTFQSNSYSNKPPYEVGDTASLMIDPGDPETAYSPKDKSASMLSKIFIILGGGICAVAVMVCSILSFIFYQAKKQGADLEHDMYFDSNNIRKDGF